MDSQLKFIFQIVLQVCVYIVFLNMEGPYISQTIFEVEKPYKGVRGVLIYAIKSHPELANHDEMIITFNSNTLIPEDFFELFEKYNDLYIPQMVKVKIKL